MKQYHSQVHVFNIILSRLPNVSIRRTLLLFQEIFGTSLSHLVSKCNLLKNIFEYTTYIYDGSHIPFSECELMFIIYIYTCQMLYHIVCILSQ